MSYSIATPESTLIRPANTTAYAQNDLIASHVTAGSVVVPSFSVGAAGSAAEIRRVRLFTDALSGWDAATFRIRLFSAAPTYTNGDNGAYARATGTNGLLAEFDVTLVQAADGAYGFAAPVVGAAAVLRLSGRKVYWDVQYTAVGALTPISGQTLRLTAEIVG